MHFVQRRSPISQNNLANIFLYLKWYHKTSLVFLWWMLKPNKCYQSFSDKNSFALLAIKSCRRCPLIPDMFIKPTFLKQSLQHEIHHLADDNKISLTKCNKHLSNQFLLSFQCYLRLCAPFCTQCFAIERQLICRIMILCLFSR